MLLFWNLAAHSAELLPLAARLPAVTIQATAARGRPGDRHPAMALTPEQKTRAERLTSLFENNTLELQYGYAEALGDGRGITAGRAGFTSGTGDMLEVVERYSRLVPDNPLACYLACLRKLAARASGSTEGLEGLSKAWGHAARDSRFRAVQDTVVDHSYFQPSQAYADALGLQTPLARAALYDAIIQHGDGDDPDGLGALLAATRKRIGGTPRTGMNEHAWLAAFLDARRRDLAHAHDQATRATWAESVGRVDVFKALAASGNYTLHGPIRITAGGYDCTIP